MRSIKPWESSATSSVCESKRNDFPKSRCFRRLHAIPIMAIKDPQTVRVSHLLGGRASIPKVCAVHRGEGVTHRVLWPISQCIGGNLGTRQRQGGARARFLQPHVV